MLNIKNGVEFIPSRQYHDLMACEALLYLSCLLYKLEVIEHPIYLMGGDGINIKLVTKLAEDYLAGHMHIYEDGAF